MNHPESSERPPESEVLSPLDETLDKYGQLLLDIEANGPSEARLQERQALEERLAELRSLEPGITDVLKGAYEKGRAIVDPREATRKAQKAFQREQMEGAIAKEEYLHQAAGRGKKYRAPNPEQADEAIRYEIWENVGGELRAEMETDPVKLAETIADLDNKISSLLQNMDSEVHLSMLDRHNDSRQMTDRQYNFLQFLNRRRQKYIQNEEKINLEYPGSEFATAKSLHNIPVKKLQHIAAAIQLNLDMLTRMQRDYHQDHPPRE